MGENRGFTPRRTTVIVADPHNPSDSELAPAADAARAGEPVVFPTDTVYGVGTNALIPDASLEIFRIKERPADKPLILLVADTADADRYVAEVPEGARALMREYWPGPLTIIFRKSPDVPVEVTAGGETVGVRCPNDPIARALIRLAGVALATTSANVAGRPSPKDAREAERDLAGRVAYIIDGGRTELGVESTVIDLSSETPRLIREGYIPWTEVKQKLGIS